MATVMALCASDPVCAIAVADPGFDRKKTAPKLRDC
jgi:hypothetical protein